MTHEEMIDAAIKETVQRLNDLKPKLVKHLDKVQKEDWFEKGDIIYFPHKVRDRASGDITHKITMALVLNPGTKKFWHDSSFRPCNQQKNIIVQTLSVITPEFKGLIPLKLSKAFGFYYGYPDTGKTTKIWVYNPRSRVNSWRSSAWFDREIAPLLVKNE